MEKSSVFLDYTMMSNDLKCRRNYFLRHVCNLVPNKESSPLTFGTMFHSVLSKWYETHDMAQALAPIASWQDYEGDDKRTQARAYEIFAGYFKSYPTEPFTIVANEVPIEQKISEDENFVYHLLGKIDLVISWHDLLYGIDHKTTSALGDSYFNKFKPDLQMTGYTWALREMFGPTVQGILINAISTAKTAGLASSKVKAFERQLSTRTTPELDRYPRQVIPIMRSIAKRTAEFHRLSPECQTQEQLDILRDNIFYPNYDSCTMYGACAFRQACLCNLSPDYLATNFKVSVWDPRTVED